MKGNTEMENKTPRQVLESIIRHKDVGSDQYTYIIMGRSNRTGKSWLHKELVANGFKAFEISTHLNPLVDYIDNRNHYVVDEPARQVIIVLNKPLPDSTYV
jgi:hypothetical protein